MARKEIGVMIAAMLVLLSMKVAQGEASQLPLPGGEMQGGPVEMMGRRSPQAPVRALPKMPELQLPML